MNPSQNSTKAVLKQIGLTLIFCFSISGSLYAQPRKIVEDDLVKFFRKIAYWDGQQRTGKAKAIDSLNHANNVFSNKLKIYTEKFPITIFDPFLSLKKEHLDIFTSLDDSLRIYVWDTFEGGAMREFANLIQYTSGGKTNSVLLRSDENTYVPFYSTFTLLK